MNLNEKRKRENTNTDFQIVLKVKHYFYNGLQFTVFLAIYILIYSENSLQQTLHVFASLQRIFFYIENPFYFRLRLAS